jgi:hypothetical protein
MKEVVIGVLFVLSGHFVVLHLYSILDALAERQVVQPRAYVILLVSTIGTFCLFEYRFNHDFSIDRW